jgi:outer membrane protein
MKNLLNVIVVAAFFVLPLSVSAQKQLKFGHLNSQEITKGMPEMDSVQLKLEKMDKEYQDLLEQIQVEYNNKAQKYAEEKDKLTEFVRKSKEEELVQLQQRFQKNQQGRQEDLQQKQMEFMQPIIEKIKKAITEVGKENGFLYIFDLSQQSVVYNSSESEDVTALVKQKLGIKNTPATTAPALKGRK